MKHCKALQREIILSADGQNKLTVAGNPKIPGEFKTVKCTNIHSKKYPTKQVFSVINITRYFEERINVCR